MTARSFLIFSHREKGEAKRNKGETKGERNEPEGHSLQHRFEVM